MCQVLGSQAANSKNVSQVLKQLLLDHNFTHTMATCAQATPRPPVQFLKDNSSSSPRASFRDNPKMEVWKIIFLAKLVIFSQKLCMSIGSRSRCASTGITTWGTPPPKNRGQNLRHSFSKRRSKAKSYHWHPGGLGIILYSYFASRSTTKTIIYIYNILYIIYT